MPRALMYDLLWEAKLGIHLCRSDRPQAWATLKDTKGWWLMAWEGWQATNKADWAAIRRRGAPDWNFLMTWEMSAVELSKSQAIQSKHRSHIRLPRSSRDLA
jgi:hypothetical protein